MALNKLARPTYKTHIYDIFKIYMNSYHIGQYVCLAFSNKHTQLFSVICIWYLSLIRKVAVAWSLDLRDSLEAMYYVLE